MISKLIRIGVIVGVIAIALPFLPVNAQKQATVFHPLTGEQRVVTVGDPNAFDGGFLLQTPTNNFDLMEGEIITVPCTIELCGEDAPLGFSVVTRYRTRLTSSITSTQSTVPVASTLTFDNEQIDINALGGRVFLSIEPGTNREEIVKCEGRSGSTWTTCTRGLAFSGTSEASVPANRQPHNAGSIVIMSNVHYVYDQLTDKDSDETIGGIKTFLQFPLIAGVDLPSLARHLATKEYVDAVGAGGATDANVGDGKTLRANNTAPETFDINTSTGKWFTVDYGFFEIATSTDSLLSLFWDTRWNATTTHPGGFTFGGDVTTTGRFVIGSANPTTNDALWVGGSSYINEDLYVASTSTTQNLEISGTCIGCTNGYQVTTNTGVTTANTTITVTASCPAGKVVVGGGHDAGGDGLSCVNGRCLDYSKPNGTTGWTVRGRCAGNCSADITWTAFAICVNP